MSVRQLQVQKFGPKRRAEGAVAALPTVQKFAPKRRTEGTATNVANVNVALPTPTKRQQALLSKKPAPLIATAGLQKAKKMCIDKVNQIVNECKRENRRFRDKNFDVRTDPESRLYQNAQTYIESKGTDFDTAIKGALPIGKIYKNPDFYHGDISSENVHQGIVPDCWFIAALALIANIPNLVKAICVHYDQQVGVYGFIFFQNGDWVVNVVDDQLFVTYDASGQVVPAFGQGYGEQTWVPLLEKAYAKHHGAYKAIADGFTGEAIEDLTGGVTTKMYMDDILNSESYWKDELMKANEDNLFSVSYWEDYELVKATAIPGRQETQLANGLLSGHAYGVVEVREFKNQNLRLLKIRNPWGHTEWKGDWSDDSALWTPQLRRELEATQEDDGTFWMSYEDFRRSWTFIERTRIFDEKWSVSCKWIHYNVEPQSDGKFTVALTTRSETVIVLQQQDQRFIANRKDKKYELQFRVYKEGDYQLWQDDDTMDKDPFIYRTHTDTLASGRSINLSVILEAGRYEIIPKIVRSTAVNEELDVEGQSEMDKKNLFNFEEKKQLESVKLANSGLEIDTIEISYEENEDGEIEELEREWDMVIGLRVYAKDKNVEVTGDEGIYPLEDTSDDDEDPEDSAIAELGENEEYDQEEGDENEDGQGGENGEEEQQEDEEEE